MTFHRLTFTTQAIFNARFLGDSQSLVLSSALLGNTTEPFVLRPGSSSPQPLGLKNVHVLAVSPSGELAVLDHAVFTGHHRLFTGTLARMPLEGGAPRDLLDNVREADWSPDGRELAVVHDVGGKDRLEFPPGTVLHESAGYLSDPRFSPQGDRIAFMEHPTRFDDRGAVAVVDLAGHAKVLSAGYWGLEGLAWSPDGGRLYFSGTRGGTGYVIHGVDLEGRDWTALSGAGSLILLDIARDGAWVVSRDETPSRMLFRRPSGEETDLSWLDNGWWPVLSADGETMLFVDQSELAGANYSVDLRPTSGGAPVRLGEGFGTAFSPDGRRVLAYVPTTPARVVSYPVGAGEEVRLDSGQFENVSQASWLPGGRRVLVAANVAGQPPRCFVLDPAAGTAEAVGPEGIRICAPSPDGRLVLAQGPTGWELFPLAGDGAARPVAAMTPGDDFVRWSPDGSALYCFARSAIPTRVDRVDVATGRREAALEIAPADRAGVVSIGGITLADDLRTLVYGAGNYRSELYRVEGAR